VRLEPDLQRARFVLAYNHMQRREFAKCREHAERTLELNPNAAFLVGTTGWMLTLAGDSERGLQVLAKGIALNPRHPGWFHMAPCIHHLRRGELEPALAAAEAMNLPDFPWEAAVRASLLARLGRRDEAREALSELLTLDPDFPRHARRYLSGYIFQDDVLEQVVEGLELLGMKTAG